MKLKRVQRTPVQTTIEGVVSEKDSSYYESLYHCCRWCKWCVMKQYEGAVCTNPMFKGGSNDWWVYQVAEEGRLSGVLEEAMHSNTAADKNFEGSIIYQLMQWGVSEKRQKEMRKLFQDCLREYLDLHLKQTVDEQVSRLYQNAHDEYYKDDSESGVFINDPESFCCKEFW